MDRLEKLATPLTAATVRVPDSVPPPGLVPMATVMLAAELVTIGRASCWAATCTAGLTATPGVAMVGCTVKASVDAAAGLMLSAGEVAEVSAPEAAVKV